jgi:hypothetical protein
LIPYIGIIWLHLSQVLPNLKQALTLSEEKRW